MTLQIWIFSTWGSGFSLRQLNSHNRLDFAASCGSETNGCLAPSPPAESKGTVYVDGLSSESGLQRTRLIPADLGSFSLLCGCGFHIHTTNVFMLLDVDATDRPASVCSSNNLTRA